ncbi:hypothetical protein BDD43_2198 [Mucilaginibacter gracilis]|uniref:Outer membrane beta-barrel porin/alpha-amylase n=1 Tax=Mucilaginibacter gracilis TaxID=423350 RepID=A0A495IZX4_9SPHI|nr:hypothetical protein [Mucilaginibacter gracilis]RKR82032.1 hypothetical protein BDD43_2198 [Mucilaginibacter gracilis]
MNIKRLLLLILLFHALTATAQTENQKGTKKLTDTTTMPIMSQYAISYPRLRQGFLATDIIAGRNITGELNGKKLYEGKMAMERIRENFNIPVVQWARNSITGTISYQHVHFQTGQITSFSPEFPNTDQSINKSTVGITLSFSRADSIFGHPVNYSGSLTGLADDKGIERVNYLGLISVPISKSKYSSFNVGLIVVIDPSAVSPVIPIISYWHKFQTADLDLYVELPTKIAVKKQLTKRSWVVVGSELGSNLYFFELNQPALPDKAILKTVDIRSGASFEYLATKKLILGVSGGVYTGISTRLFDHNDKSSDYFFRTSNGSSPYISFSISFLPFLKSIKR